MAITVKEDLVTGAEAVSSLDGYSLVRVFEVQGIDQGTSSNKLHFALNAAGIPKAGDAHPTIPDLICEDVRAIPWADISRQGARVIARYMDGSAVLIRVNGTLVREQAWTDLAGNVIEVTYNDQSTAGEMLLTYPHTILEYERIVREPPGDTHLNYFGYINSKPIWGKKAKQWLCIEHSFQPSRGTFTNRIFRERFAFEGKATTNTGPAQQWDPICVFIDRNTGRPPPDIDPIVDGAPQGNGWKRAAGFPEADFKKLGLPSVL